MTAPKTRTSSFSRNISGSTSPQIPGFKHGPNGTTYISSGVPDLDKILGGGYPLGSLVMIMEDTEAPHHMLLLRNFMSQGLVHNQSLLYASPSRDPRAFLGTLPNIMSSKDDKPREHESEQEKGLRIAWQYRKYFGEQQQTLVGRRDAELEFCNDFDLRKPLERHYLGSRQADSFSLQDSNLTAFRERCSSFLAPFSRSDSTIKTAGRIAILSLYAPQCEYTDMDWEMLSFIRSLKAMLRSSNAVAIITFPPSLLSPSFSNRWQHLADILLSVKAIPDEDKELADLLTGYQDMIGLLKVHKISRLNTQVPATLEATTFSIKLKKRRSLVLECLNQAPIDGSSGTSYASSGGCSGSSATGKLDF